MATGDKEGCVGLYTLAGNISEQAALEFAFLLRSIPDREEKIDTLLLRISSNGGSLGAAESILESIDLLNAELAIPTVAFVCETALSAAFFLAVTVRPTIATNTAILGNAGAIIRRPDLSGLLNRIGIEYATVASGPLKDSLFPANALSDEAEEGLTTVTDGNAEFFMAEIRRRRSLQPETSSFVEKGGIMNGAQACAKGLIDETGGFLTAIAKASQLADTSTVGLVDLTPPRAQTPGALASLAKLVEGFI